MGVSSSTPTPTPTPGHGPGIATTRSSPGDPQAPSLAPPDPPSYLPRADPGRAAGPSARRRSCARTRRGPRSPRPPRRCASPAARRPRPTPLADDWPRPSATFSPRRSAPRSPRAPPRSIGPTSGNTREWPTRVSSSSRRRDNARRRDDARRRRPAVELASFVSSMEPRLDRDVCPALPQTGRDDVAQKKPPPLHARCPARDATARGTPRLSTRRLEFPLGSQWARVPGAGWVASTPRRSALSTELSVRGIRSRFRARASSRWSAFSFGQRVESRLRKTTRPGRALSGDRAVQRGLPVHWHRKRTLGESARREMTPRFRVHRRETGPRPSVWSLGQLANRKTESRAPRLDGRSRRKRWHPRANFIIGAFDFESGLRVTFSVGKF